MKNTAKKRLMVLQRAKGTLAKFVKEEREQKSGSFERNEEDLGFKEMRERREGKEIVFI